MNYLYQNKDFKNVYAQVQTAGIHSNINGKSTAVFGINQIPAQNYQQHLNAKENQSLRQQQQTYYQPLQYQTPSGRIVQRTASPMILQQPHYVLQNQQAGIVLSPKNSSSQTSSGNKYVPSFSNNVPASGAYSAEKTTPPPPRSYLQNNYPINQYQLRSPYVSSFTTAARDSQNVNASSLNSVGKQLKLYPTTTLQGEENKGLQQYQGRGSSTQPKEEIITRGQTRDTESLSPSKRVTFNLAKNTYTDIEQIEKRLAESTRLRPINELEGVPNDTEQTDPLSKRFDQAINRSERIINDFLRVGRRESIDNNSVQETQEPHTPKMVRNPSRSKSPIKSSLKRTMSFTGSPQKNSSPNILQQRLNESPLSNQTNKLNTNGITSATKQSEQNPNDLKNGIQISQGPTVPSYNLVQTALNRQDKFPQTSPFLASPGYNHSVGDENSHNQAPIPQRWMTPPPKTAQYNTNQFQNTQQMVSHQRGRNNQPYKENEQVIPLTGVIGGNPMIPNKNFDPIQDQSKQQEQPRSGGMQNTPPPTSKPRQGILRYSDSSRYDGDIVNSTRQGYGTLLSSEFQVIYQGNWENDTYHGQGRFFNPLSENLEESYDYKDFDIALRQYWESFEGGFFEGKLEGYGTLMLTNGEKLVGNFKKGRISGQGTFYCNKGPAITGKWEDNRLIEKF